MRRVLVFGGTGHVGQAVLRQLTQTDAAVVFTWHTNKKKAKALTAELGYAAYALNLKNVNAIRSLVRELMPDVLIHAAAINVDDLDACYAVNCRSAYVAVNAMPTGPRDVVLLGGLDRVQSLPLPPAYAATQGMLSGMVMALARALGPDGLRINLMALGPLDGGLSTGLGTGQLADYERFSALRRRGTADEAAKAAVWLALENTYLNGKTVPVNGGI